MNHHLAINHQPLVLLLAAGLSFLALPSRLPAQQTLRVSVASSGAEGNQNSFDASISAAGRFVAFGSVASNLVPGDTNGFQDVFVHDLQTGQTTRVSVDHSSGAGGNNHSFAPSISADGRFVAFNTSASNLVPGDTNRTSDVFVRDLHTGQTTRVSVDSSGAEGNAGSAFPSISADGRFVAFDSLASNLVPGDMNGTWDVFIHDLQTGLTTRVSVDSSGAEGNSESISPSISAAGRFVAFESWASNLVPGDTNGLEDVFVHDLQTGQTTRVSLDTSGSEGNNHSDGPSISAAGRFVTFGSVASNLVPGDTNGSWDVFVHDLQTGQTTRVSVDTSGAEGNNDSRYPSISADGRFVAFDSSASNLVPGDTDRHRDVFVHDRLTRQTTRVSVGISGAGGNNPGVFPSISADGRFVTFHSSASNLVHDDTNGTWDVFVHGPLLRLEQVAGTCLGPVTFTAFGATPGGRVAFVWGDPGPFTIPAGKPCGGLEIGVIPIGRPAPGFVVARADAAGEATATGFARPKACGRFFVQAIDLSDCRASNRVGL